MRTDAKSYRLFFKRKNRGYIISGIGAFIVTVLLITLLALPLFDNRERLSGQSFIADTINKKDVGTDYNDTPAYYYFNAPVNSWGIGDTKIINDELFWDIFDNESNVYWQLFAWHPVQEIWVSKWQGTNLNEWLNISTIRNETTNLNQKVTLNITNNHPTQDLYFRLEHGYNISLKSSLNKSSNYEYFLVFPANETEDYEVFFNWSDIKPLVQNGTVIAKTGIKNINGTDYFGFRITQNMSRNPLKSGSYFEIDPNFGNDNSTVAGVNIDAGNKFVCTKGRPDTSGTLDNITVYFQGVGSGDVAKMYIYDRWDLVYESYELREANGILTAGWCTHEVNSGTPINIVADEFYYVGAMSTVANQCQVRVATGVAEWSEGGGYRRYDHTYGREDNPLTMPFDANSSTASSCAYASYTESGGPSEQWNIFDFTLNGTAYNSTIVHIFDTTLNGTAYNVSRWANFDNTLNGKAYNLTRWNDIDNSLNGSAFNLTRVHINDNSLNGSAYNLTRIHYFDNSLNGTAFNQSRFAIFDNTLNGTAYNNTIVHIEDNSLNGSAYNESVIGWKEFDTSLNGTAFNLSRYVILDNTLNGTAYNQSTIWSDNTLNGTAYNQTPPPTITISFEYPENRSFINGFQPTLHFQLNHTEGLAMNYSVYNGTTLLYSGISVGNGTYSGNAFTATNYSMYNWSVVVEDASNNTLSESYLFNISNIASVAQLPPVKRSLIFLAILGAIIAVFVALDKRRDYE